MDKGLVLLGSGGHAGSCADIVDSITTYSISCGGKIFIEICIPDTRVLSKKEWDYLCKEYGRFILGVGQIHNSMIRREIVDEVSNRGGQFVTLISPYAKVSSKCKIGTGAVIMPNVSINRNAVIGNNCILNTGCIIEHDAKIGNFCHISTGAVVNGDCVVGNDSFIGSNAVLLNQIKIGNDISIGAGSVVTRDLTQRAIYVGNPAFYLKDKP